MGSINDCYNGTVSYAFFDEPGVDLLFYNEAKRYLMYKDRGCLVLA